VRQRGLGSTDAPIQRSGNVARPPQEILGSSAAQQSRSKGIMKHKNESVPLAICDRCRARGGCELGFPARWRYETTQPDPQTGWKRTKMDNLTKPKKENRFKPPVKAFGDRAGRFIVGESMCDYVHSLPFKAGPRSGEPIRAPEKEPHASVAGDHDGECTRSVPAPTPPIPPAGLVRRRGRSPR
jgi:hypothetical protein